MISKVIPEFPLYLVREDGQIYSTKTCTVMRSRDNGRGYQGVVLRKEGNSYTRYVHRLVASAFLGESDLTVNHVDGDKSNNHVDNLEYVTISENIQHAYDLGLNPTKPMQIEKEGFGYWSPSQKLLIGIDDLTQQDLTKIGTGTRRTAKGWSCNLFNEMVV